MQKDSEKKIINKTSKDEAYAMDHHTMGSSEANIYKFLQLLVHLLYICCNIGSACLIRFSIISCT